MKYIEIYLNERQQELEKKKAKEIEEFREKYRNCTTDKEYEILIEDCYIEHYMIIEDCNMKLEEIENLRNDLFPKADLVEKENKYE